MRPERSGAGHSPLVEGKLKGISEIQDCDLETTKGPDPRGNGRQGFETYTFFATTYLRWMEKLHAEAKANSLQLLSLQSEMAIVLCHGRSFRELFLPFSLFFGYYARDMSCKLVLI